MNEKIKSFFIGVGSAIALFFATLFTIILRHDRCRTDSGAEKGIQHSEELLSEIGNTMSDIRRTNSEIDDGIGHVKESSDDIRRTKDGIEQSIKRSENILDELEKRADFR